MVQMDGSVYIIQPTDATGQLVYHPWRINSCGTEFSGGVENGFITRFYSTGEPIPYTTEMILFELPSGEIREQFPLFRCEGTPDVCHKASLFWTWDVKTKPAWSPDGRYLAFAAVVDTADSDLFIYDTQTGELRHFPHSSGWAGYCEWSPDGTHIILQETYYAEYPESLDDYNNAAVSSVSVRTGESAFLYAHHRGYSPLNIIWLDNSRFVNYEGFLGVLDSATNLRFVDFETGESRILFDGHFPMMSYDPIHETFLLYAHLSHEQDQGYYFVTVNDGVVNYMFNLPQYPMNFGWWDENTGLFVSEAHCEDEPESLKAVDYLGNPDCVPELALIPKIDQSDFPAPNGAWNLSVGQDGINLQNGDNPAVLVSDEIPSDVIWCPDSSCFFYSVAQSVILPDLTYTLYRVSLPDLTVEKIDEGIELTGSYQWVGGE